MGKIPDGEDLTRRQRKINFHVVQVEERSLKQLQSQQTDPTIFTHRRDSTLSMASERPNWPCSVAQGEEQRFKPIRPNYNVSTVIDWLSPMPCPSLA